MLRVFDKSETALFYSYLDYFAMSLGDYCEEPGKRYHQNTKEMDHLYQERRQIFIGLCKKRSKM